jgi:hypothetical protein
MCWDGSLGMTCPGTSPVQFMLVCRASRFSPQTGALDNFLQQVASKTTPPAAVSEQFLRWYSRTGSTDT